MSRACRAIFLLLTVLSLVLPGCKTSTPYTRMYSPRKNYFVPPPEKPEKSAEELIKATEPPPGGATDPGLPGALPPPGTGLPGEIPPPPPPPVVDPLAPAPAAPL